MVDIILYEIPPLFMRLVLLFTFYKFVHLGMERLSYLPKVTQQVAESQGEGLNAILHSETVYLITALSLAPWIECYQNS